MKEIVEVNGKDKSKKRIVIIGAGPAGITAGYELLKQGKEEYEVIILEESNEIGGISRTVKYNGNRMDIGGHRFFSKDDRVMEWWENLMPIQGKSSLDDKLLRRKKKLKKGGPNPETEDRVMLVRNRVSRIFYRKKFFDYPISLKWQTIRNMGIFTTIRAGFSYLFSCIHKREETSLENFYINRFGKVLYSMFFEGYTEKLWGRHPSEISADWGAQRVKGLSITAIIKDVFSKLFSKNSDKKKVETSLIEEFYYPKFGPGQLWETAAEEFEKLGGSIQKNCRVVGIHQADGHISSLEYEENQERKAMEADIVISSMPLKDFINGMNDVPESVRRVSEGLPYRDFVTVGILVERLNLKNETNIRTLNNIVPDCWIYVQDTGVKLGRIQIFNNWSPYLVQDVKDKVWIGLEYFCKEGDKFWNMSEKSCVKFVARELVKMGIISSEADILDSHREKVKKAYPAYFDTYDEIDKLVDYLNTIDNLYCVGRNGQHRYNNMDHSMVTSFEAVYNIIHNIKDRSNIWNVNTEEEYHEAK
ncbi:MAG: NAD(P)/FAD-dependent oxidoreductase [Lachnospiraceae bacterium]|nr:NAD(P)/FAD-dependent oxidoreductase [Lachnospiraceae bacterium]